MQQIFSQKIPKLKFDQLINRKSYFCKKNASQKMKIYFLGFFLLLFQLGRAQKKEVSELLRTAKSTTAAELVIELGKNYLGTPYIASTLEGDEEKLVCRLDGFDCYTFVETMTAMALAVKEKKYTETAVYDNIRTLRYRNGVVDDYASRIHYFVDWGREAEKKGILTNISPAIGTLTLKNINFMSTHRQYYAALKTDDAMLNKIAQMEHKLADYQFFEIKKEQLPLKLKEIKTGDIIAFASTINGLDVNHEGLAYWEGNTLKFMHASIEQKKVMISDESLLQYINRIKKHSGLIVMRLK